MIPIVYRTTDNSKWGAGKNSKLTMAEGDGNLWELAKAITSAVENPPAPVSIANILVVGYQMTIQLTDGRSFGPFALPVASFHYRKDGYVNGDTYNSMDLLPVDDMGLYLVLETHVASGAFDPNATDDSGNPLFQLLFGEGNYRYEFSFSLPGKPGSGLTTGDLILQHVFLRDAYFVNFDDCIAHLDVAPSAEQVFNIKKNADEIGTLTFASGANDGVFALTFPTQFNSGDILAIEMTDNADSTSKALCIGFFGTRGLRP
jgi:hypothetical protein